MMMRCRLVFVAVVLSFIMLADLVLVRLVLAQSSGQTVFPAPPRVFLDTSYTPPSGRTIAVGAGGDLQAALNAAQPGDVITLGPAVVFRGNFSLPKKAGPDWIVVRSGTSDDKLPAP